MKHTRLIAVVILSTSLFLHALAMGSDVEIANKLVQQFQSGTRTLDREVDDGWTSLKFNQVLNVKQPFNVIEFKTFTTTSDAQQGFDGVVFHAFAAAPRPDTDAKVGDESITTGTSVIFRKGSRVFSILLDRELPKNEVQALGRRIMEIADQAEKT
jgi:hypothetical protein